MIEDYYVKLEHFSLRHEGSVRGDSAAMLAVSRAGLPDCWGHNFHRPPAEYGVLEAGTPTVSWLQFVRRISVMTDPATAIKREVLQLVELQIETLRREGKLTDCDLEQYRARSGKVSQLYRKLDRIGRTWFEWRSERAS
jgi:hypothetical protein